MADEIFTGWQWEGDQNQNQIKLTITTFSAVKGNR